MRTEPGTLPDNATAPWIARVRKYCQPTSVWHQRYIAACAGAASTLAMAPFHLWPILWLTLPALLLVTDAAATTSPPVSRWAPWRRFAFGHRAEIGWWFGFGYHLIGLHWIVEPFLIEAEVFAWLIPVAVTVMPAGLALFTAGAVATTTWSKCKTSLDRVLLLSIGFGATEWLRGHILTGFPWNVLGYALTWPLALMQSASIAGIYGLTALTVLIFAAPYATISTEPGRRKWWPTIAGASLLLAMLAFGQIRLATNPPAPPQAGAPVIRIVQPSIAQRERLQPENRRRNFDQHLQLSRTRPDGVIDDAAGISVIVWPEAAMPFVALSQPVALQEIGELLGSNITLVSGALRAEAITGRARFDVFNSLLAFTGPAEVGGPAKLAAVYDKIHLVPFGEYLPLQPVLEAIGLEALTRQRGGFAAGQGPRKLLELPGLQRILPLICYEAIFPGLLEASIGRPNLMVLLTNDGWFGTTTGPRQHYHQGRVRAVETGVPLLRASSNGVSAMIDPLGREQGRLQLNASGSTDVVTPAALGAPFYARSGDIVFFVLLFGLIVMVRRQPH